MSNQTRNRPAINVFLGTLKLLDAVEAEGMEDEARFGPRENGDLMEFGLRGMKRRLSVSLPAGSLSLPIDESKMALLNFRSLEERGVQSQPEEREAEEEKRDEGEEEEDQRLRVPSLRRIMGNRS